MKKTVILYLVCLSAFFASLNQNIYTPVIPLIRDSFHVSINMVNFSVSMFIFIIAIMQIIFGVLIDFKGSRAVLIPGIAVTFLASIGCAVTTNFTVFLFFRGLQAVGTAAVPLIAATSIGRLFKGEQRGNAMGTYQTLLSLAPALAPVLGGVIGARFNYSGIFWFLVALSALLLLANGLYYPKDKKDEKKTIHLGSLFVHYGKVFKNKVSNAIFILSFCIFFIYFSIIVYLPVLLTGHFHLKLEFVGFLYLPISISLVIGSLLFKKIQSRFSLQKLSVCSTILLILGIGLFTFFHGESLIGLSAALMLYGLSTGLITPLFGTVLTNEFESNRASALGMFNFVRYLGMTAGPVATGFLIIKFNSLIVFGAFGLLFTLLSSIIYIYPKKLNMRNQVRTPDKNKVQ